MLHVRQLLEATAALIGSDRSAPYPRAPDFHERTLELAGNSELRAMAAGTYTQLRLANLRSGSSPGRERGLQGALVGFRGPKAEGPRESRAGGENHIRNGLKNVVNILADKGTKTTRRASFGKPTCNSYGPRGDGGVGRPMVQVREYNTSPP